MNLSRNDILADIERGFDFPAFPEVVLRLEEALAREDSSHREVAAIIEADLGLSARFLRVANSPVYAGPRTTVSIQQAVVRLGFAEARHLATTTAVLQRFGSVSGSDSAPLWRHSVAVGQMSRVIGGMARNKLDPKEREVLHAAGLLHDIGALVLRLRHPEAYDELERHVNDNGGTLVDAERTRWDIDHAEVGALVAASWHIPEAVAQSIRFHHTPASADPACVRVASVVHLADFIATNQGMPRSECDFHNTFDDAVWDLLGLSLDDFPAIIEGFAQQAENSRALTASILH